MMLDGGEGLSTHCIVPLGVDEDLCILDLRRGIKRAFLAAGSLISNPKPGCHVVVARCPKRSDRKNLHR